jgi:protein-disulfide isomerase
MKNDIDIREHTPYGMLLLLFLLALLPSEKATAQSVNQDVQNLIAKQLKATFKQTTFTNLESAPIDGWYQAEISNQVVYFSPTQALMFFGEVYTKNGISLSEQTRRKWQSKRTANLDVSAALVIGTGVIEIIEFTDTDCSFCQRFNRWITAKNDAYKDKYNQDLFTRKIVLTPIDQLHPNAHKEALHILCQSPENYETAITQTLESKISFAEMDSCQQGKDLLIKHRKISKEFGVSATPTLVINGQIVQGFNQQKLEAVIKQQLKQTIK